MDKSPPTSENGLPGTATVPRPLSDHDLHLRILIIVSCKYKDHHASAQSSSCARQTLSFLQRSLYSAAHFTPVIPSNMLLIISSIILLALFSHVSALPLNATCKRDPGDITEAQLLQIAPNSRTCDPAGPAADECRTAAQAVRFINAAHKQFGINTKGEKAALVSLQAFESVQFKFDRNQ